MSVETSEDAQARLNILRMLAWWMGFGSLVLAFFMIRMVVLVTTTNRAMAIGLAAVISLWLLVVFPIARTYRRVVQIMAEQVDRKIQAEEKQAEALAEAEYMVATEPLNAPDPAEQRKQDREARRRERQRRERAEKARQKRMLKELVEIHAETDDDV